MDESEFDKGLAKIKAFYSKKEYKDAIKVGGDLLPIYNNPKFLSEVHLILAKSYKGLGDLKTCISSCNSAIEHNSKWKEPYLYRSACYQALHTSFLETDGETSDHIEEDRKNADIIVDPNCTPTDIEKAKEAEARRRLLRKDDKKQQIYVQQLDEALRVAECTQTIFIEKGTYRVSSGASKNLSSFFILGKNLTLIGASVKDCILLYQKENQEAETSSKLETFLICGGSNTPTLIKRLTFRNGNSNSVKTKFFGVGGGHLHIEDCLFDGSVSTGVDAVYANSAICGTMASSYPAPHVTLRFCVFDNCQSYGTATLSHSCGEIYSCYFVGCGRSAVLVMDSSKVVIEHCEISQTELTETAISCTGSELNVSGSYLQGVQGCLETVTSQGIGLLMKSVATIEGNYFYSTGTGVASHNSDLVCKGNMILSCSRRYTSPENQSNSTLGLYSGVTLRGQGKVQLSGNITRQCDVGFHIAEEATPIIKENVFDSCFYSGVFAECEAKPNIVNNNFGGGDTNSPIQVPRGLGILFIQGAKGLIGKNQFDDYTVSPIMIFTKCHPMLKQNTYINISIKEERQANLEKSLLNQFHSQLEEDSLFYIVDSQQKEEALWEVILKGTTIK